mgnify:CR=1 FL=1
MREIAKICKIAYNTSWYTKVFQGAWGEVPTSPRRNFGMLT